LTAQFHDEKPRFGYLGLPAQAVAPEARLYFSKVVAAIVDRGFPSH
jgi:hypothetical protein